MLRLSFTHFAFPCYLQINIWTLCEIKFIKSVFVSPKLDQSNAYNCRKDSFSSYYQSFILKRIFNQSGIISNIHMFLCENILDPAFTQRVLSNCPCLCVRPSNLPSALPSLDISRDCSLVFSSFGPQVYPKGSLVIALVRLFVRLCVHLSLNISETPHSFFLNFCMKGRGVWIK